VAEEANKGRPVLGICNGFQVLTEAGILPGALMRNAHLTYICKDADLRVENNRTIFTSAYEAGEAIAIPVAHHDGNFQADAETLRRIEGEGQVVFRYACTVNGSANDIAGLANERGNVLGMMPHPERAAEPAHGNEDGRRLFESLIGALAPA
jgi:phosphoribosylformylglycinamidine synthase